MTEPRVNQQSAVNTWYLRFLKNLETEYHAELAWNLIMMGRAEASISIDVYKPFLNRYKDEILKAMLTAIANKDTELNYSDRELGEMMVGARKLGLAWPELDIMERSMKADQMIKEARYSRTNLPKTDRGWISAVSKDPYLINYNPSPSEAVQLAAVKTQGRAIRYIKSPTEAVQLAAVQNDGWAIEFINKRYTNIRAPSEAVQLAAVIRDGSAIYSIKNISQSLLNNPEVKRSVVTIMLKWIKGWGGTDDEPLEWCMNQLEQLRNANCTWPELDIIERSLRNMPTQSNPNEDIVESSDWYATIEQIKASIGDVLESKEYWRALTRMDHLQSYDPGKVRLGIDLEKHRQGLIREMLELIKSGETEIPHGAVICMQTYMGINWPELDAIKRSLDAGQSIKESDDEHDEYIKHVMAYLKSYLLDRQYYDTFDFIQGLADMDDVPHDLKPLFDQHKHGMMTSLLKFVKHTTVGNYISPKAAGFDLATTLDGLRNLGVDWPELKGLEKSVRSDRKAIREDAEIPKDLDAQIELIKNHPWMIGNMWAPAAELQRMVLKLDGSYLGSIKGGLSKDVIEEPDIRHNIIKYLLTLVKQGDLVTLGYRLEDLRWKNVNWPEIKTIRKSLAANKQIREDDAEDDPEAEREQLVSEIIEAMTSGSGKTLRYAMDAMHNLDREGEQILDRVMRTNKNSIISNLIDMFFSGNNDDANRLMDLLDISPARWNEISRLPDSILQVVQDEFDSRAKDYGLAETLEMVDALVECGFDEGQLMSDIREHHLPRMIERWAGKIAWNSARMLGRDLEAMVNLGVDHTELAKIANKRRTTIVRELLVGIKGRQYHDANLLIASLRDIGMDWKELATMEKSLGSIHTLGESEGKLHGFARREIEELVADTGNELMKPHTTLALRGLLNKMHTQYQLTMDEMREFLAPIHDAMLTKMDKDLQGRGINIALGDLSAIKRLGLLVPEMTNMVQQNKTPILRHVFGRIGELQSANRGMEFVERLESFGIDWPELDTIRRSAAAEFKQNREQLGHINESGYDALDELESNLKNGRGDIAITDLAFNIQGDDLPRVRRILESNKAELVRAMLLMLRDLNDSEAVDDLDYVFTNLFGMLGPFALDLKWKELDTIKRSWESDEANRLNQEPA